jgi:hypothetical protein
MSGTLISELDSRTPDMDGDLVQQILADMNTPSQNNTVHQPSSMPPPASNGRMINSPNPNSTYPQAVDPGTATAHMIGKEYPTPSDFSSMMTHGYGPNSGSHAPVSAGAMAPGSYGAAPGMYPSHPQPQLVQMNRSGNWYSEVVSHFKQPLLVAIIIFIINLPIINVLMGHYLPTLLRVGGDLTTAGLLVKSLVGGLLFWFIQRVLAPLVAV